MDEGIKIDEKWLVEEFGKGLEEMEGEIISSVSNILSKASVQEVSKLLKKEDLSEEEAMKLALIARLVFFDIPLTNVAMEYVNKNEKLMKRYEKMRRLFNLYGAHYLAIAIEQEIEDLERIKMLEEMGGG